MPNELISKSKEKILEILQDIFFHNPSFGALEKPTQDGLLWIAQEGAYVWNTWQEKHPQSYICFSNINFSILHIDFSGFVFSQNASGRDSITFEGSNFFLANFRECHFPEVSFINCEFDEGADFSKSSFLNVARFARCKFGRLSSFSYARFNADVYYTACVFMGIFNFKETKITSAFFAAIQFGYDANFSCALSSESAAIESLSFEGCEFRGKANFSNRAFEGMCNFGESKTKLLQQKKAMPTFFKFSPHFSWMQISPRH